MFIFEVVFIFEIESKCGSELDKFKSILARSSTCGLTVASGYPKPQKVPGSPLRDPNCSIIIIFILSHFVSQISQPLKLHRILFVFKICVWVSVFRRKKWVCKSVICFKRKINFHYKFRCFF